MGMISGKQHKCFLQCTRNPMVLKSCSNKVFPDYLGELLCPNVNLYPLMIPIVMSVIKSKVASTEIVRVVITHNSLMQKFHHLYFNRGTPSFSRRKRLSAIMPIPRTRCLMSCL